MNVLLCLSHSIEEHDQLLLLHELGLGVASLGGYIDPAHPHDPKRPPLPQVPKVQAIREAVDALGGNGAAQNRIPGAALDWLGDDGVIIWHHLLERLLEQWPTLRDWLHGSPERRVIWRTVGQSNPDLEAAMAVLRRDDLEIVRYSPAERTLPGFAGEDALIRFYKDPGEWHGWIGDRREIVTVAQNLKQRDPWTNYGFWLAATDGLPAQPLGVGSETVGGPGVLDLADMQDRLRHARAYLYTGTQPASYTLALIEAMMTGIPVVSIGRGHMGLAPWIPALFEAADLVPFATDDPAAAQRMLRALLDDEGLASDYGAECRATAVRLFSKSAVAEQWRAFLRVPALVPA